MLWVVTAQSLEHWQLKTRDAVQSIPFKVAQKQENLSYVFCILDEH